MAATENAADAGGKKRKQVTEENGTPMSQKRLKKDVSNGTPKKGNAHPALGSVSASATPMMTAPQTLDTASSKKEKRTKSAQKDSSSTTGGADVEQTPKTIKSEPDLQQRSLSKKERKKLQAETPSKDPQAMDVDQPSNSKPTSDDAEAERKRLRAEAKKARRKSLKEQEENKAKGTPTVPQSSKKAKATNKQEPAATPSKPKALNPAEQSGKQVAKAKLKQRPAWSVSQATAGRFIENDPIFVTSSGGDDFLAAATAHEVQILSLDTSLPAASLRISNIILSFAAEPGSAAVSILDNVGRLTHWDWENNRQSTTTVQVKPRAYDACIISAGRKEQAIKRVFTGSGQNARSVYIGEKTAYQAKKPLQTVQIVGDFEYLVAHGTSVLVLGKREADTEDFTWAEVPISTEITCAHGTLRQDIRPGTSAGLRLAVGLADGQIHLFEDLASLFDGKNNTSLPSPRVLHWHRDAVSAVKFSTDGRYLISGGKETVMVLWQLETGKKQYLPHLTSEIERIVVSPAGDRYAVQMGDNSIMVLSTSELKPVANFAGLQMPTESKNDELGLPAVAATLHPTQPDQLLLTVPSTQPKRIEDISARPFIQAFDLHNARHISRQALTRNNVTDFNLGPERTPIIPPDVAYLAISHDGQCLATVDEWVPPASDVEFLATDDESVAEERLKRREVYLKIWQWDAAQSMWTLTTRVDAPHARESKNSTGAGRVLALVSNPSSRGFATVGEDSTVRFWRPKTRLRHGVPMQDEQGNDLVEWLCKRTTELEKQLARVDSPFEDGDEIETELMAPSGANLAFSDDGSMIVAAMTYDFLTEAPVAHFIDSSSGEIKQSRDNMLAADLAGVGFLDRYLIALSRQSLKVWDVVQDELISNVELPAILDEDEQPLLAIDSGARSFAIAVPRPVKGAAFVEVFDPTKQKSVHREEFNTPIAALLAGRAARGYVLLFSDATTRTLSPTGAARTIRSTGPAIKIETEAVESSKPAPAQKNAVPNLLAPASAGAQGFAVEETEDDRPVVRPEQLANIFDVGQGVALPSVRDMFRAVAGLYGRKPVAVPVSDAMDVDV